MRVEISITDEAAISFIKFLQEKNLLDKWVAAHAGEDAAEVQKSQALSRLKNLNQTPITSYHG